MKLPSGLQINESVEEKPIFLGDEYVSSIIVGVRFYEDMVCYDLEITNRTHSGETYTYLAENMSAALVRG